MDPEHTHSRRPLAAQCAHRAQLARAAGGGPAGGQPKMGWGAEVGRRGRGSASIGARAGEKWGTTSVGDMIWLEGRRGLAEEGEDTKRRYETRNTKVGEEEEDQEG